MIDQITFEALYTAQARQMTAYVARHFGPAIAEDVVADAFTKIWRNRENVSEQNLAGYVQTTVRTVAIDTLRVKRNTPTESIFADGSDDSEDAGIYRVEPQAPSDHNPAAGTLARILEVLTPEQRIILVMRHQGYKFREIAVKTGRTEDACKKLFSRAQAQAVKRRAELSA